MRQRRGLTAIIFLVLVALVALVAWFSVAEGVTPSDSGIVYSVRVTEAGDAYLEGITQLDSLRAEVTELRRLLAMSVQADSLFLQRLETMDNRLKAGQDVNKARIENLEARGPDGHYVLVDSIWVPETVWWGNMIDSMDAVWPVDSLWTQ